MIICLISLLWWVLLYYVNVTFMKSLINKNSYASRIIIVNFYFYFLNIKGFINFFNSKTNYIEVSRGWKFNTYVGRWRAQ